MKNNLPAGWSTVKIGDILNFSGGGTPSKHVPKFWNGDIPWASVKDVKGKYLTKTQDTITKEGLDASATQLAEAGSVLMVTRMAPGRPIITQVQTAINQDLKIVRPKFPIPSLFIYYAFLHYERKFLEIASGTTVQGIRVEDIKELEIPFPPLAEQNRIVAQLEATMQKLEASQERLENLPALLKKFRQAVLAAAVSGKLTEAWRAEQPQGESALELLDRIRAKRRAQWEEKEIKKVKGKQLSFNDSWKHKYEEPPAPDTTQLPELPDGWIWESVELLSERIVDCPHSTPEFTKDGEYCIDTNCIESGRIRFDKARFVTPTCYLDRVSRLEPRQGDILFAREGTIGTTAMVPPNIKLCLGQRMMMFRPAEMIPSYFMWSMISDVFVRQWRPKVMGTSAQHVNIRDLRVMALPVCSLLEQQEIVRQVNHYFELADQLEARFEQAAALVEQLPQALLAKAFSGQLVQQDPNDEPASVLLERLAMEAPAPAKGKRGRAPKAIADAPLFD